MGEISQNQTIIDYTDKEFNSFTNNNKVIPRDFLTTLNNNIKKCRNIKKLLKTQIENLIVFLNMKLN